MLGVRVECGGGGVVGTVAMEGDMEDDTGCLVGSLKEEVLRCLLPPSTTTDELPSRSVFSSPLRGGEYGKGDGDALPAVVIV